MRYYDIPKHWTKRIMPHLGDPELNQILVRDFHKFTYGRWKQEFKPDDLPHDFETCDWWLEHRGPMPRYWKYVKHSACHWLANFALRLAMLVEPTTPWRIVTSDDHSTVWDGRETLFDLQFLALGVPADDAFDMADEERLEPGELMEVYFANHCRLEQYLNACYQGKPAVDKMLGRLTPEQRAELVELINVYELEGGEVKWKP